MMGAIRIAKLDFIIMKSQLVAYLSLVVILISFGIMGSSATLMGINGAWFMALMSTSIFAIQEKNNLDRLYGSVSVKWKDIIRGRYIFVFLSYVISFIMAIIIYTAFIIFQKKVINVWDIVLGFSISFFVFSVIIGIQMPMFFRMGYTKSRAWALLPYLVVIALFAMPIYMSALFGFSDIPSLASILSSIIKVTEAMMSKQGILIIGGIFAGGIIQYISYCISVVAYRKHR